ncbi:putative membrane bound protease protein [Parvularcula bermudensis HTCC2503]|uniref:Protein HflK n=1 Tax=Parvularcula bermudensis (strain ATCC BAA-594 / HTCC2503 / KCTC 12087) TaxID=314260 RepID=E0TCS4_PARBH|nr:FtsH protease activity modulator HflK [Parvularcula bermudensis]ADM09863.1 putative membrane bound protease protein [Parvularcula bermudensis HTCC2503]
MPWTDKPGGSGSGSGNGSGPWGRPGGQNGGDDRRPAGGRQSPDLEELLRSGRERFRRGGGGGSGSGGGSDFKLPSGPTLGIAAVAIVLLWLLSGLYSLPPGARGVVTTFGNYSALTGPGLNWRLPWPFQDHARVQVDQDRSVTIGRGRQTSMVTSDLNIVDVQMTVDYQISPDVGLAEGELPNAAKYIFNIENPDGLVRAVSESALRQVVGESDFSQVIAENRASVSLRTQEIIQEILDSYSSGIEIIRVNFGQADPPEDVIPAQRDVIDARSGAEQLVNEANRYRNNRVPRARGEAREIELAAEAYGQRVVREARGAASRFNDIYAEYVQAPDVTRERMYLETMEGVLGTMNKVVIDDNAGGALPYLNLNELVREGQRSRSGSTPPATNQDTTGGQR